MGVAGAGGGDRDGIHGSDPDGGASSNRGGMRGPHHGTASFAPVRQPRGVLVPSTPINNGTASNYRVSPQPLPPAYNMATETAMQTDTGGPALPRRRPQTAVLARAGNAPGAAVARWESRYRAFKVIHLDPMAAMRRGSLNRMIRIEKEELREYVNKYDRMKPNPQPTPSKRTGEQGARQASDDEDDSGSSVSSVGNWSAHGVVDRAYHERPCQSSRHVMFWLMT